MKLARQNSDLRNPQGLRRTGRVGQQRGTVLVVVLWVSLGLVATTIYFAQTMSFELRTSENRVAALTADEAIAGAARYVALVLASATNGTVPEPGSYFCEAVPVGDARFWLLGRASDREVQPDQVFFGLIDEGRKLNLNTATAEMLLKLTNVDAQLAANIYDWRNTNGTVSAEGDGPTAYSRFEPAYMCKNAPYDTVEELRLVYRTDLGILFGEDANLNGALDPSETDTNRNNYVDVGIVDQLTVYSREPNTQADGSQRTNIRSLNATQARALLQTNVTSARLNQILLSLGLGSTSGSGPGGGGGRPGGGGGGGAGTGATATFRSPLEFYRRSTMTPEEFAPVATNISVGSGSQVQGRVNVNTAPAGVLACLPGMTAELSVQLVNYRKQYPQNLTSIAWVAEALQDSPSTLSALQAGDYLTTQSFQYTADIAAVGAHGRGYRRIKYVFDVSSGTPKIIYRQDLSHLGWALGRYTREDLKLAALSR